MFSTIGRTRNRHFHVLHYRISFINRKNNREIADKSETRPAPRVEIITWDSSRWLLALTCFFKKDQISHCAHCAHLSTSHIVFFIMLYKRSILMNTFIYCNVHYTFSLTFYFWWMTSRGKKIKWPHKSYILPKILIDRSRASFFAVPVPVFILSS